MTARTSVLGLVALVSLGLINRAAAEHLWLRTSNTQNDLIIQAGIGLPAKWNVDRAVFVENGACWIRTVDGTERELPLTFHNASASHYSQADKPSAAVVSAVCQGHVAQIAGKPTLVRYIAQRYVGSPSAWPQMYGDKRLALEILPLAVDNAVNLTVLDNGAPVAGVAVKVFAGSQSYTAVASEAGELALQSVDPNDCLLSVEYTRPESGQLNGKYFEAVQDRLSLSFAAPVANPVVAQEMKNPADVLVRVARPRRLGAFSSSFRLTLPDKSVDGELVVRDGVVEVQLADAGRDESLKPVLQQVFAGLLALRETKAASAAGDLPRSEKLNAKEDAGVAIVLETAVGPDGAPLPRTVSLSPARSAAGSNSSVSVQCSWTDTDAGLLPTAVRGVLADPGSPKPFVLQLQRPATPATSRLAN